MQKLNGGSNENISVLGMELLGKTNAGTEFGVKLSVFIIASHVRDDILCDEVYDISAGIMKKIES